MAKNVLRGKNLLIKYKDTLIPLSTAAKITLGTNTVDSTTKEDDEDWDEVDVASRNWSITADRLLKLKTHTVSGTFGNGDLPSYSHIIVGSIGTFGAPTRRGISTIPVFCNVGDKITVSEPHEGYNSWLCGCEEYKPNAFFRAFMKLENPGSPYTYTVESPGLYFIMHDTNHDYPHPYSRSYEADPLATLLVDLPLEAPIIVDIDGDQYTGNALITQHDLDGSVKQNQTHSLTITGTGELTKITN